MSAELLQAVLVDIVDPARNACQSFPPFVLMKGHQELSKSFILMPRLGQQILPNYSHTSRTSCRFPPLPHALNLALPMCLCLADHVIIIESFTSCSDEERGAEKGGRASADFFDLGD